MDLARNNEKDCIRALNRAYTKKMASEGKTQAARRQYLNELANQAVVGSTEDNEGFTALHFAAKHDPDKELAKILLEMGADPSKKCADGYTPLHWIVPGTSSFAEKLREDEIDGRAEFGTFDYKIYHIVCQAARSPR